MRLGAAHSLAALAALGAAAGLSTGCLQTASQAESKRSAAQKTKKRARASTAALESEGPVEFPTAPPPPFTAHPGNTGNAYLDRFVALWNDIHNPANGYFSPDGVPYHAPETMVVEAPDYGHETTSEAYSYWIWLESAYGHLSKDWRPLQYAWKNMETFIIPTKADQPTAGSYNYTHPAVYSPEQPQPNQYPSPMQNQATPGWDPLWSELKEAYGEPYVYGMHWILDVDNFYGYGRRGDGVSKPSYMNTFQRGMEESVWETIPQPSWDNFKWGGANGYLDLFVKQDGGYARQWKYTAAPDADARAIQAMYWAKTWADEQGGSKDVDELVKKSAKMGDFLRYSLFDKYFKVLGCRSPSCPTGKDRESAHYLISWYYAWGGSTAVSGGWAWRIGSSTSHQGYQNPFAAYVLSNVDAFKPSSKNAVKDWAESQSRQLEMLRWLQSADGAIAGGVSNSWQGRYGEPPPGATFYQMAYDEKPVWVDPPSNQWFGFQAWGIDRTAQLYHLTGDERAKVIMDRWVGFVKKHVTLGRDGSYKVPSTLEWKGAPGTSWDAKHQNWNPKDASWNKGLRCTVKDFTDDVGVTAALARTLTFYAKRSGDNESARLAKELLDRMWTKFRDKKGLATVEARADFKRFNDTVFVPSGWTGKMPNGDVIDQNATFLSLRSKYKQDPDWPKVDAFLKGGKPPEFTYHRFWAQSDIALANATFGWLFPQGVPTGRSRPTGKPAKSGGKPGAHARL